MTDSAACLIELEEKLSELAKDASRRLGDEYGYLIEVELTARIKFVKSLSNSSIRSEKVKSVNKNPGSQEKSGKIKHQHPSRNSFDTCANYARQHPSTPRGTRMLYDCKDYQCDETSGSPDSFEKFSEKERNESKATSCISSSESISTAQLFPNATVEILPRKKNQ